ncbi:hypothetical protein D3C72_1570900 [compost metagenome]
MYNNYAKTEVYISNSADAKNLIKSSSKYVQQNVTFATRSDTLINNQTIYNGKAYVLDVTITGSSTSAGIGQYLGSTSFIAYSATTTGKLYNINKFVSILGGCRYYANNTVVASISYLKI